MASILRPHFLLDPRVVFLNHGSFGACPRGVLDRAQAFREAFERDPIGFVTRELEPGLDLARNALADFVGSDPVDLAFVKNASTGVSAVLASLELAPDDEIVVTNHGYGATNIAAEERAARAGARVVKAEVPFPIEGPGVVVERVLSRVTPKTRLVLIDHVTSPTGLVFPIAEIAREVRPRGIEVLVDGAHGPGMLPLALSTLGVDYYVGNLHKWCCTPKGTAFLWAARDRQPKLHPLVRSHGARSRRTERSRFLLEFDWVGTDDPSGVLCLPFALEFVGGLLPGGWAAIMRQNHELLLAAREVLLEVAGGRPACPDDMLGSLLSVVLADARGGGGAGRSADWPFAEPLYSALRERHGIEAMVIHFPERPRQLVRVSAHVYNDIDDYRALARALRAELG